MISAIQSSLAGMAAAAQKVEKAAVSIADMGSVGDANLVRDIVDLKLGENLYKANIAALKTSNEMTDELVRILDKKV